MDKLRYTVKKSKKCAICDGFSVPTALHFLQCTHYSEKAIVAFQVSKPIPVTREQEANPQIAIQENVTRSL